MRVLRVVWKDAMLSNEWRPLDELSRPECEPASVVSYGWEVQSTEHYVTLACSRANAALDNEQLSGVISIPRECILEIKVLVAS